MTVMRKRRRSSPRPIVAHRSRDAILTGGRLAVEASCLARCHVASLCAAIAAHQCQGCVAQGAAPHGSYDPYDQAGTGAPALVHGRAHCRGQGTAA